MSQENVKYGHFALAASGLFLTYAIPNDCSDLVIGQFCSMPIKRGYQVKKVVGLFVEFCEKPEEFECHEIYEILPFSRPIPQELFELIHWSAEYYLMSFPYMAQLVAPGFVWDPKKHKALLKRVSEVEKKTFLKLKGEILYPKRNEITLNQEQEIIFHKILNSQDSVYLLHGVTGSGKTEVYLKLALQAIQQDKTALILLPEISLTPQMSSRFRAVFQEKLAVLHSGLPAAEYEREWIKILHQKAKVLLGVRTSIFAPLKNIGLIVVDEEHDSSYKSQDYPVYHARDIAVVRSKIEKCKCILGSATPSVESYYNCNLNKYVYLSLGNKYFGSSVNSKVISSKISSSTIPHYAMRSSQISYDKNAINPEVFSYIKAAKEKNKQSIVIVNRRGYFNFSICKNCSTPLTCPKCSVSTTIHSSGKKEICHYCDFDSVRRTQCPKCHSREFINRGVGTQQIEENLKTLSSDLRLARLDRDVMTSQSRLAKLIEDFRSGEIDCLVGTQMLSKGHDFPNVSVVVVLHVEDSLFIPDFRSSERTFQLLCQSMGRAGRSLEQGQLVLQSLVLGNPVVELALKGDSIGFLQRELEFREMGFHPPFSRQILIEFKDKNKDHCFEIAQIFKVRVSEHWQKNGVRNSEVRLAGPYSAALEKINEFYRVQILVTMVKSIHPAKLFPGHILHDKKYAAKTRIEVDPYSFI